MRIGGSLLRRKPRVHIILSRGFEHTYADMAAISASDLVKVSMLAWDIYNYGFAKECNASK